MLSLVSDGAWWTRLKEYAATNQFAFSAIVFVVYVLTARFGLMLHPVNSFATLIWPPTGIAIFALFAGGYVFWPVIALGAFAANYATGASFVVALFIAFGNTLEAYMGAYLLKEWVKIDWSFSQVRDALGLIGVASVATLVSASIGSVTLWFSGIATSETIVTTWLAWWVGDALGALVVVPLLLVWFAYPVSFERLTLRRSIEYAAIGVLLVFTCWLTFWTSAFPYVYPLAIPLGWAALRAGTRGTTLSVLVLAIIGIAGTLTGHGAFALPDVLRGIFFLQFAVAVAESLFLIFSSVMSERSAAVQALKGHVGTLEDALDKKRTDDKAKNEFLAILAHELRNPLAPILSTFEYLKIKETDPESAQMIQSAERQAQIMKRLLDDMLDVARVTQKTFKLKKRTTVLQEAVKYSVQAVEPFMKTQQHTFTASLPNEKLWLDADPARITQIFTNVLYNAAKYTKPGGKIELRAKREGEEAVVSVKDNGAGIPADMLEQIFEPFVSVNPLAEVGTGLGVGLSLTRRLLEMHDGTIEAKSRGLGTGSTFTVRLPLLATAPRSVASGNEVHDKDALRREGLKILIVDDNEAAAKGLGKLLEHSGHEVFFAFTGAHALETAKLNSPSVMLVDIGLPDISGYDVARQLRKQGIRPRTALIALTGYGQESDKRKARAAGFDHHLTKPVSVKDILNILDPLP